MKFRDEGILCVARGVRREVSWERELLMRRRAAGWCRMSVACRSDWRVVIVHRLMVGHGDERMYQ